MENNKIRVIQVTKFGGPEVLALHYDDTPVPKPGEALIQVKTVGVVYNDFMQRTDFFHHEGDPETELPFTLGTEGVGEIIEVDKNERGLITGQRVAFVMHSSRSYADKTVIPISKLIALPDDISNEEVASMLSNGLTAQILLHEYKKIDRNTTVLITGAAGTVGSLLAQWSCALGGQVIGTINNSDNIGKIKAWLGIDYLINSTKIDMGKFIEEKTKGKGVDLALDAVGGEQFMQVFSSLARRGMAVPYGIVGGYQPSITPLSLVEHSRVIAGYLYFDFTNSPEELQSRANQVFEAYRKKIIRPLVSKIFPLEEAIEAHQFLNKKGRIGKILLTV